MESTIRRPTTRTRRLLVSAIVAALLLTVTPPTLATTQSGDHNGCVSISAVHFLQHHDGLVKYDLENPGSFRTEWKNHNPGHILSVITISGYWAGGWWSVEGTHPAAGTAYMHCHT